MVLLIDAILKGRILPIQFGGGGKKRHAHGASLICITAGRGPTTCWHPACLSGASKTMSRALAPVQLTLHLLVPAGAACTMPGGMSSTHMAGRAHTAFIEQHGTREEMEGGKKWLEGDGQGRQEA